MVFTVRHEMMHHTMGIPRSEYETAERPALSAALSEARRSMTHGAMKIRFADTDDQIPKHGTRNDLTCLEHFTGDLALSRPQAPSHPLPR
jgi:hypothetical protein